MTSPHGPARAQRPGPAPSRPQRAPLTGLASAVSAGPAAIECWFVEDAGGGRLAKRPAALLLRQGPGAPPPRPDLDPKLYLRVHGESRLLPSTSPHRGLGV